METLESFERSKLVMFQAILGERVEKLHYYAIVNAFQKGLNWSSAVRENRELRKAMDKLFDQQLRSVYVQASDRKSASFHYKDSGDSVEDFNEGGEYEHRHPGTSYDSDDEELRNSWNQSYSPITMKAGQHLLALGFAGAGNDSHPSPRASVLLSTYALQLTIRVDDKREALNFDCFEYRPSSMDLEDSSNLPTVGSLKLFETCGLGAYSLVGYKRAANRDQVAKPLSGRFSMGDRATLLLQATAGELMAQRLLRFRVRLSSIQGARLVMPKAQTLLRMQLGSGKPSTVSLSALVLELSSPPEEDAFAARKVFSSIRRENQFTIVPDWTPNKVTARLSSLTE